MGIKVTHEKVVKGMRWYVRRSDGTKERLSVAVRGLQALGHHKQATDILREAVMLGYRIRGMNGNSNGTE